MRDIRRGITRVVIGSFAVAAAMGIFTLLRPGQFNETEAKVMLTTLVVGVESILALCYLSVAEGRWRAVGLVGGAVSLAAAVLALAMVWGGEGDDRWKAFGVTIVVAIAFAQASLLLAVGERAQQLVRQLTLATTIVVAAMCVMAIMSDGDVSGWFWRTLGVVAILNVLGSIVTAALGLAGRRPNRDIEAASGSISPATLAALRSAAAERGVGVDALVREALDNLPAPNRPAG